MCKKEGKAKIWRDTSPSRYERNICLEIHKVSERQKLHKWYTLNRQCEWGIAKHSCLQWVGAMDTILVDTYHRGAWDFMALKKTAHQWDQL